MNSINDDDLDDSTDDSASPLLTARRVFMMRRLLTTAVARYEAALSFCEEVDALMPESYRLDPSGGPDAGGELGAWWRTLKEADDDFFSAENALAGRIINLYNCLASEDQRIVESSGRRTFQERSVSVGGTVYVLNDDPVDYEVGRYIISLVRPDRVIDLDD